MMANQSYTVGIQYQQTKPQYTAIFMVDVEQTIKWEHMGFIISKKYNKMCIMV